ncbi:hypothetical protein AMATHDRAFT_3378 [Amanita thiersii Skay4041]|uniref:Large ribosomal subunit protein uL30m n=1 Tax=Amanita thiersii Skay4041 TaxID=703135 RepID=A0A2A9NP65_9AGAR|nr:hypothetical protein AMATHDRAFT_3378 [Amanita thiersii Skay4041]
MASIVSCRRNALLTLSRVQPSLRALSISQPTTESSFSATTSETLSSTSLQSSPDSPTTHFKITLRRSAISLGDKKQGTLKALGLHRRMQTVYHKHSPEVVGKILAVKELVEVENVPPELVRTKQEQRQERKAPRGYTVVRDKRSTFMRI